MTRATPMIPGSWAAALVATLVLPAVATASCATRSAERVDAVVDRPPSGTLFDDARGRLAPLTAADLAEHGPSELATCLHTSPARGWVVCLLIDEDVPGARRAIAFADLDSGAWVALEVALDGTANGPLLDRANALLAAADDWEPLGPPVFTVDFNHTASLDDTDIGGGRIIGLRGDDLVISAAGVPLGRLHVIDDEPTCGPRYVALWTPPERRFAVVVHTEYSDGYMSRLSEIDALSLDGAPLTRPTRPPTCAHPDARRSPLLRRACADLPADLRDRDVRVGWPAAAR